MKPLFILLPVILALTACQSEEPAMPADALYQAGGLWEVTTKLIAIDGMEEKEALALIKNTNENNADALFQECRPELSFAKSPKVGDVMDVGDDQGLICKFDKANFTTDSMETYAICRDESGTERANIAVSGAQSVNDYTIKIITSFIGGISNTVEEKGRRIKDCEQ